MFDNSRSDSRNETKYSLPIGKAVSSSCGHAVSPILPRAGGSATWLTAFPIGCWHAAIPRSGSATSGPCVIYAPTSKATDTTSVVLCEVNRSFTSDQSPCLLVPYCLASPRVSYRSLSVLRAWRPVCLSWGQDADELGPIKRAGYLAVFEVSRLLGVGAPCCS